MKKILALLNLTLVVLLFHSCNTDGTYPLLPPTVTPTLTTKAITSITTTSAMSGGFISSEGDAGVLGRGVVWSTNQNPTLADNVTLDGSGTGSFNSGMTGLTANATYYVRAYATSNAGTAYGNQLSFIATTTVSLPIITTTAVTNITASSATSGGSISSDGGDPVIERGVVYNTAANPTTANNKTVDGTSVGTFTSAMTGLTVNTTYYVRAYATNSAGTAYGNQLTFTTTNVVSLAVLTTTALSNIGTTTATGGGNITSDGGAAVSSRGIVWGTAINPTTANFSAASGSGIGSYTSPLAGLNTGTTYYVRAYATNSVGTAYGNELSFTTSTNTATTVTDVDGNVYQTINICAQKWTQKNLNVSKYRNGDVIPQVQDPLQWDSLTTGAWCYYQNATANGTVYGKLYNWYALADPRGLAPLGWHVPTETEWVTLANCIGGFGNGGKLKEAGTAHWQTPNTQATNITGFTALPGGYRGIDFDMLTLEGYFWTITDDGTGLIYSKVLNYGLDYMGTDTSDKASGYSVRCIQD